jgi:putative pyruvate formate lyase activating enzyme
MMQPRGQQFPPARLDAAGGPLVVPDWLAGEGRFTRSREGFAPAYLKTYRTGRLEEKVAEAQKMLRDCHVCPRNCAVDRWENELGACHSGRHARVTGAFPHHGEEDCLRGWRGSGTIFFAWCNLRCVFCQNFETSQQGEGEETDAGQLAELMLGLQSAGCHNINFVTPEHVAPQILEALPAAIEGGLELPIVYNTGAYDSLDSLRLMDGVVDIYMPDFKLWDPGHCQRYLKAPHYAEAAREVIAEMHRQVGDLVVDGNGLALRGLLVRHLVMPELEEDTRLIMDWLGGLSHDTYVNVMDQYRPAWKARTDRRYAGIGRGLRQREFDDALAAAKGCGLWRLDQRWLM